ncbi:MAG: hypothetical protein K6A80_03380 [Saccharofermentans sp.]|nr:hypothetical protein [Saccharofermentans sp.]
MGDSYILKDGKRCEFKEWKNDYTQFLEKLYELPENPYNDPDAKDTKNVEFYSGLAKFLTKQEEEMRDRLNEEWTYKAVFGEQKDNYDYGIQVFENGNKLFVLFSDQFGFSAPDFKKNHPYDYYIKLAKEAGEDKYKEAISNVAEWIFESRSIGGSFLWPRHGKGSDNYNYKRGGAESYSSYIQDRVDLTLLEIKHIFDEKKTKTDILYSFWNSCGELKSFFDHFGSFDTYIDFFKMEDFVKDKMPRDIFDLQKCLDDDKYKKMNEFNKNKLPLDDADSIFRKDIDTVENMLNNVNGLINKRTGVIAPIIQG